VTTDMSRGELAISPEEIRQRRRASTEPTEKTVFRVAGLYGFSRESLPFPISRTETIDSGPISISMDPESDNLTNLGVIDYENCYLRVRYSGHMIFPGIHELVTSGKHDLSLLGPVRATATDDCIVEPDLSGWRALGTLDFLPGSIWAGAAGG
jgi:hypothetical protein